MRGTIRLFLPLVFAVGFLLRSTQAAPKPNFIFVRKDDLGYGEIGPRGQKKILAPNPDRIAREGLRFTQFYAGTTVCAPSHCVLMTGKHFGHGTVRGNAKPGDAPLKTP
jgi:arylsulfatase A-like enzyme